MLILLCPLFFGGGEDGTKSLVDFPAMVNIVFKWTASDRISSTFPTPDQYQCSWIHTNILLGLNRIYRAKNFMLRYTGYSVN